MLVDSSVLIDLVKPDERWSPWSRATLASLRGRGVFINQIIYAECLIVFRAAGYRTLAEERMIGRLDLSWEAAARAAEAHSDYRRRGGPKEAVLPDFLIGAHAAVAGLALLTRDPRRIRTAFPEVQLITPDRV